MDTFKIDNYERMHGRGTFVSFRSLSNEEANRILEEMKDRLNLPETFDAEHVDRFIRDNSQIVDGFDATVDGFDLKEVFSHLNIQIQGDVLLNWYRFDRIDELEIDALCRSFNDLWYPSLDDLDIFNPDLEWIVSIEHFGVVKVLRESVGT